MIDRYPRVRPAISRFANLGRGVLAGLILALPTMAADERPRPPTPPPAKVAPLSGAAILEKAWPDHPEWLAMLVDIFVVGDRMGGNDGWFRKAVAQTRFDWKATCSALDKDGDQTITRPEFAGPDTDFSRLDRNRDGALTAADFDFSPQPPSPGVQVFGRADRDGNGKITREEFNAVFRAIDSGGLGFLSQADLQQAFAPPLSPPKAAQVQGGQGGPTRSTFLKSFLRRELGAFPSGPALDESAPDFTLRTVDGKEEVTLSKVVGPKPVVLVFGNFTCGPFRGQAGNIEKFYRRYQDRAAFLMVYVREAHPTDGWRMEGNDRVGVAIRQPRTDEERRSVAEVCNRTLGLGFPMLVDTVDDTVNDQYSGIPSRLYLIDSKGKIAFKSGRGPFGFKPAELEQSLILLLDQCKSEDQSKQTQFPNDARR
jgi:Iodothyronine deiodinase/EF hand